MSPEQLAEKHYQEDTFRNPYAKGSDDWVKYQHQMGRILDREEQSA